MRGKKTWCATDKTIRMYRRAWQETAGDSLKAEGLEQTDDKPKPWHYLLVRTGRSGGLPFLPQINEVHMVTSRDEGPTEFDTVNRFSEGAAVLDTHAPTFQSIYVIH